MSVVIDGLQIIMISALSALFTALFNQVFNRIAKRIVDFVEKGLAKQRKRLEQSLLNGKKKKVSD
jgi:uncharacterized protein YyaL (SSP411 family)